MSLKLEKTWELVVRGETKKSPSFPLSGIERKNKLNLFGVTLNENLCNWVANIDSLLRKAGPRMYFLESVNFMASH